MDASHTYAEFTSSLFGRGLTIWEIDRAVRERFPDYEQLKQFHEWMQAQQRERLRQRYEMVPREQLVQRIDETDFFDHDSRAALVALLLRDMQPLVPLGRDRAGNRYRLMPSALALQLYSEEDELRPPSLITVCVPEQRPAYPSPVSSFGSHHTDAGSPDADGHAAAQVPLFHQLGSLEYSEEEDGGHGDDDDDGWKPSGYALVARIGSDGFANALYAIAAMAGDGDEFDENYVPPNLPAGEESFWSARLCGVDRLGACADEYSTVMSWSEKERQPLKLAEAVSPCHSRRGQMMSE